MQFKSRRTIRIKTYEPKPRIEIPAEHAVPFLSDISSKLMHQGGFTSFLASLSLGTIKGFFAAKEKIEEANMKKGQIRICKRKKSYRI